MADPREDAYVVAALLSELERVLHPLPRGQRGEVRPEIMLPPPLPPPPAPASSRGGQPGGTAGGGVAFAAPTPRLPGEDVPRAGLSRFPLPAAAPPTGAGFDEGPAGAARAGRVQDVAESGRAAAGETPATSERGEASVHAKDFPGLAESPRPSGRAEQSGTTATGQAEGSTQPGAAQPASPAVGALAAPVPGPSFPGPPVPGPPASLDVLVSEAPEAGEKPPARPPRLPLPPSQFRAPDGAKALTPPARAGTPAAGQEPATAPPVSAAPADGRALPFIPVAAAVLPLESQRPPASPKDAPLGRGGRQAPASAEPGRTFDEPAAAARQDRLADGQATAVSPAGPSAETEESEFGEALLEPAETALPPPARRQPSGRLALRLTAAEALRLDRRVKGAYLDRALLRCL